LGPAGRGKFGEMQPADGELTVSIAPRDKTLYENVVVVQRTGKPIDFVATGLINISRSMRSSCAAGSTGLSFLRVGAVSWTVSFNSFAVRDDHAEK